MASKRDYYEILGVSRDATTEEIRRAYRKLARQYHPDVNKDDPDAEEKFKEINEAHRVLTDPEARARYDRFGHAAFDGPQGAGGFGGFDPSEGFPGFEGFGDIFDIFETFMGGGPRARRRGPVRGRDLEMEIVVEFEEAVFGAERTFEVPRRETCSRCHGNGAEPGTPIVTCPDCGGTGQVRHARQTPFGQFVTATTCGRCGGEGKFPEKPCTRCGGRGITEERRRIRVRIPAGIDTGYRIRLSGEGDAGQRGGPPGDLYLRVRVRPHKLFVREGADIILEQPISFVQAALGAEIEVPTLEGTHKLTIPEGTQHGTEFRLRGQGVPRVGGFGRGDQVVRVKIEVPRRLTQQQKDILLRFAEATGDEAGGGRSAAEKLRDTMRKLGDTMRDTFSGGRQAK
ncbi:MAG: molecular chaperone DnaJ [Limnochordales bacterium]|nr:MAG: molecular chaperone DnaJ [Bacillota bacterium]